MILSGRVTRFTTTRWRNQIYHHNYRTVRQPRDRRPELILTPPTPIRYCLYGVWNIFVLPYKMYFMVRLCFSFALRQFRVSTVEIATFTLRSPGNQNQRDKIGHFLLVIINFACPDQKYEARPASPLAPPHTSHAGCLHEDTNTEAGSRAASVGTISLLTAQQHQEVQTVKM